MPANEYYTNNTHSTFNSFHFQFFPLQYYLFMWFLYSIFSFLFCCCCSLLLFVVFLFGCLAFLFLFRFDVFISNARQIKKKRRLTFGVCLSNQGENSRNSELFSIQSVTNRFRIIIIYNSLESATLNQILMAFIATIMCHFSLLFGLVLFCVFIYGPWSNLICWFCFDFIRLACYSWSCQSIETIRYFLLYFCLRDHRLGYYITCKVPNFSIDNMLGGKYGIPHNFPMQKMEFG